VYLTRRAREMRRTGRALLVVALTAIAAIAGALVYMEPRESEKPLVVLYMKSDCSTCQNYAHYLGDHGFRVQLGSEAELRAVRERARLPRMFQAPQVAVVEDWLIVGPVPAADIHDLLNWRNRSHARGLVVPGMPRGAPGVNAAIPEPFTVYLIRGSGLVQPLKTYNHVHYWR